MRHEQTIVLSKDEAEFARDFLKLTEAAPDCEDVPLVKTARFGSCVDADIKLCNGNGPYVDAVLFQGGNEVMVLEPEFETMVGEYVFDYGGAEYVITVKEAE